MKVAMVTPWAVRCGIYTYSKALSEALAELGVDVYVVRLPRFGRKVPEILRQVASSVPDVDVIHVQEEYGLYQGMESAFYGELKQKKRPIVSTLHAVGNWDQDRIICGASNVVITHNEFCSRRLGHPNVIIPHGCTPAEPVAMKEAKESYGLRPGWPIIGYLGFISSYKNLEVLVEAMTGLPDAGLLVGGGWHVEGAETGYIQELKRWSLEKLPGRVQWLGYVQDRDLPRAYGSFDVLCYPSRFSTESGALLQALSYGKAVITSSLPPFLEKEKLGALTCFEDVEDLRMKIGMLIGNPELRAELEEGARRYAESVSWPRVAELHRSLYEDVVSKL